MVDRRIFREGDMGSALCETCEGRVSTTYRRRDVPLSDGSGTVKDVMAGVCDQCGDVVMIPHQSVPRVNQVVARQRKSLEVRVPSHLKDMLLMVNHKLEQQAGFDHYVVRYYLARWAERGIPVNRLRRYRRSELFHGPANSRLSYKFRDIDETIAKIHHLTEDLGNNAELLKVVTFAAYDDVIENPNSQACSQLKAIAAACG